MLSTNGKLTVTGDNQRREKLSWINWMFEKEQKMLLTYFNVTIIQRAILDEDDIQPETSQIQSDTELDV